MTDHLPSERQLAHKEAILSHIFKETEVQIAKRRYQKAWLASAAAVGMIAIGAAVALNLPKGTPPAPAATTTPGQITPTGSESQPPVDAEALPRITVGKTDAPYKWAAVQAFADDIADGKVVADKCWAVRPELRNSYTDIDRRKEILANLQKTPRIEESRVVFGIEIVSQDQRGLDYQCTVSGQVYGVGDEQLKDVRWALERYAGVLEGKPLNPADTYAPFCRTTNESEFLKGGKLTPEGKAAYLKLIRGNYEAKPMGGDSNMYIFGPVGSLDPQLGYINGVNCIYAFYPNK